jgi:hypothetical protein
MIKDGASLDEVMKVLGGTFGGAAATAANTAAGKFKILKNSLDETKESIGAALLPVVEKVLPVLQKFADWAQKNPQAFLAIASAITAISVAIMAVNFAMALNPFTAIAAGVAALVVGIIYAYNKFETFRNIVNSVLNGLMKGFEVFANTWINTINKMITGINAISPFTDIDYVPKVNVPTIGGSSSGGSGIIAPPSPPKSSGTMPGVSMPSMPSPSAPVAGGGGGGSQGSGFAPINGPIGYVGGIQDRIANRPDVTINVSGGISSAADIGRSVVDALTQYTQVYGPLDLAIR